MRALALIVALSTAVVASARAATHRVPDDFATVTAALGAAGPGDVIEVAPGTYAPSTGETYPLVLDAAVHLVGAGMGLSILDAEGAGSVVEIDAPGDIRLSGFTITGGAASRGGGVHVMQGEPEIDHNLVWGNSADNRGSGINIDSANAHVHHNVVWQNFETQLGVGADPHGIQLGLTAGGVVEHNLVGRGDSNGLFTGEGAVPVVRNNVFFENGEPSLNRGRGMCALGDPATVIAHNLFWNNVRPALLVGGVGDVTAQQANDLSATDGVYGNLDADPLLADPDAMDFTIPLASPAVDAGDPASPLDPDGTIADIGPFFVDQSASNADAPSAVGVRWLGNAPNPFNPSTTLRFEAERGGHVRVEVLDPRGRRVRAVFEGEVPRGSRAVRWDGRDDAGRPVASGVYLASITMGRDRSVGPMVLVR